MVQTVHVFCVGTQYFQNRQIDRLSKYARIHSNYVYLVLYRTELPRITLYQVVKLVQRKQPNCAKIAHSVSHGNFTAQDSITL